MTCGDTDRLPAEDRQRSGLQFTLYCAAYATILEFHPVLLDFSSVVNQLTTPKNGDAHAHPHNAARRYHTWLSMSTDPSSLTRTPTRNPLLLLRMWLRRVVFPLPKKPANTHTRSCQLMAPQLGTRIHSGPVRTTTATLSRPGQTIEVSTLILHAVHSVAAPQQQQQPAQAAVKATLQSKVT